MRPSTMNRFHGATTLLVVCSLLNGCQTSPAPEELEAFERRVLDEYLAFEKAQEPSEQNGLTMRDYYERVADPELNPRAEAIDWLVELEAEHRGTQAGLDATCAGTGTASPPGLRLPTHGRIPSLRVGALPRDPGTCIYAKCNA